MALTTEGHLHKQFNLRKTFGADATNSDATLVIDGYENFFIKCKSFPDPSSGISGNIEVPMPLGNITYKPQQAKTAFNGSASFIETETRDVQRMLNEIKFKNGGYWDGWIYQGTPEFYTNRKRIRSCFFEQPAPTQRDFQSNTELLLLEGDISGNYFGEMEEGNLKTLMGSH